MSMCVRWRVVSADVHRWMATTTTPRNLFALFRSSLPRWKINLIQHLPLSPSLLDFLHVPPHPLMLASRNDKISITQKPQATPPALLPSTPPFPSLKNPERKHERASKTKKTLSARRLSLPLFFFFQDTFFSFPPPSLSADRASSHRRSFDGFMSSLSRSTAVTNPFRVSSRRRSWRRCAAKPCTPSAPCPRAPRRRT